ncbi:MAG: sigma-70 family RNA polymerase sigma factor [Planctomyces sp.]|nr:sigma-70 family RNA polymerase sigma factor [Planctomyces sp.]
MQKQTADSGEELGRKSFIEEFYREHSRELWALFYAQCSDPDRAYDAVQESFLKFFDHKGEPIRDPRAWLLRVGQNWLRDVARKKVNSSRQLVSMDEFAGQPDSAGSMLEKFEQQTQIRSALKEMNEDDRKVLVMKYALDWSTAKIAAAMDSNAAAVDMRLSRARRRLAEILVERGFKNE